MLQYVAVLSTTAIEIPLFSALVSGLGCETSGTCSTPALAAFVDGVAFLAIASQLAFNVAGFETIVTSVMACRMAACQYSVFTVSRVMSWY